MEQVDAIVREENAQPWLNHDFVQTAAIRTPPSVSIDEAMTCEKSVAERSSSEKAC